jgi:hypothetical protein
MSQKRIFFAVQQVGVAQDGTNTFTSIHGLQSVGINTKFNLEQVFEMGQLAIYQNVENVPDVDVTMEKVIDGYPLIYHLLTQGAPAATLVGRSNVKAIIGLSIYPDTNSSASGTPLSQCTTSGMFVSSLDYTVNVNGNCTESVTAVGNNKVWNNSFTATAFTNTDVPAAASGVQRRQHVLLGSGQTLIPSEIPGTQSDGSVRFTDGQSADVHLQSIRMSANLGREALYELGHKGPYHRYVNFPVEVRCDIEILDTTGDQITALQEVDNLTGHAIKVKLSDSTTFDLGSQNKVTSVTQAGANASNNGGNGTVTYSYITYNDFTVSNLYDPTTGLRM